MQTRHLFVFLFIFFIRFSSPRVRVRTCGSFFLTTWSVLLDVIIIHPLLVLCTGKIRARTRKGVVALSRLRSIVTTKIIEETTRITVHDEVNTYSHFTENLNSFGNHGSRRLMKSQCTRKKQVISHFTRKNWRPFTNHEDTLYYPPAWIHMWCSYREDCSVNRIPFLSSLDVLIHVENAKQFTFWYPFVMSTQVNIFVFKTWRIYKLIVYKSVICAWSWPTSYSKQFRR